MNQLGDVWMLCDAQRPVHDLDEAVGQDADVERGQSRESQGGAHGVADGELFFALFWLAHEHGIGDLQVVVEPEDGVEHAERGQHVVAG